MPTRQAVSIARIRARRRRKKKCVQCGGRSVKYRCEQCRRDHRKSMRSVSDCKPRRKGRPGRPQI